MLGLMQQGKIRPTTRLLTNPVIKSTQRTLDILELFDLVRGELTAADVAQRLGYPQSSTAALLHSLERMGYLDYFPATHGYLPTFRVMLLGSWLDGALIREGRLIRMLEAIAQETGLTVMLAARFGIYSQYLHVVLGSGALSYYLAIGSRRLLVRSATGFALLRDTPEDEIRALVRRAVAESAGDERYSERDVLANVQLVKDQGYFLAQGLVQPGMGALAVRLPDTIHPRNRALAVATGGPIADLSAREEAIASTIKTLVHFHYGTNDFS
jgi:DNA-binding IclR family transcriptional regulator